MVLLMAFLWVTVDTLVEHINLMTPILKPENAGEVRYNTAYRRTRCVIERCFGLLKRRFPCLHLGLRTALVNTLVIIVATGPYAVTNGMERNEMKWNGVE